MSSTLTATSHALLRGEAAPAVEEEPTEPVERAALRLAALLGRGEYAAALEEPLAATLLDAPDCAAAVQAYLAEHGLVAPAAADPAIGREEPRRGRNLHPRRRVGGDHHWRGRRLRRWRPGLIGGGGGGRIRHLREQRVERAPLPHGRRRRGRRRRDAAIGAARGLQRRRGLRRRRDAWGNTLQALEHLLDAA